MFNPAHEVLYAQAINQGRRGQLWSALTGRSRGLLDLEEAVADRTVQAPTDGGTRAVPIHQIRGSENRGSDFDRDFNPLQSHTRERWLGIAAARQRGRRLPPVALVQVGNAYFVRDGHHRISVAHALGYTTVDATVQVWQADGPLPDAKPAPAVTYRAVQQAGQLRHRVQGDYQALVSFCAQRLMLRSRRGHA